MSPMNLKVYHNPEPVPPMISIPLDVPNVRVLNAQLNDQGEFIRRTISLSSPLKARWKAPNAIAVGGKSPIFTVTMIG